MILLILILALGLRLISLNQSLWFDEAINVWYAQSTDLFFYLTKYILGDFHPPLWFLILWLWGHIFGFSEAAVRSPSLIFGVLTIYITYLVGLNFSKKVALLGSLLMAFSPLHIYYSQEARPYALASFTVILSSLLFLNLIKNSNYKNIFFYSLSLMLVLYSDYPAYFVILAQFIYLAVNHRNRIVTYLKSLLIAGILFLGVVYILVKQLILGIQTANILRGWGEVVGGSDLKNIALLWVKMLIGKISFDNNYLYGLVIIITSLVFISAFLKFKFKEIKKNYLFYLLIIPPLLGILISFFVPIFLYFRFLYILPAFYLLVAMGIEKYSGVFKKVLLAACLIILLNCSLVYLFNPDFHREDWREAVRFLDKQNSLVLFENSEVIAPYLYYSQKSQQAKPAFKKIPADSKEDISINLNDIKELYVVNYLKEITDPSKLLERNLDINGFKKDKSWDFRGVGFITLYSK